MLSPSGDFEHTPQVIAYLRRLYADERREFACRATTPDGVSQWRSRARIALRRMLGLERMQAELEAHKPTVTLQPPQDRDDHTICLGHIETEPDYRVPFYLLQPHGAGPFPLAVMPHGHEARGHETYAGVYQSDKHRQQTQQRQADVGLQAVRRGFVAITVNTRGFEPTCTADLNNRHNGRDCLSHATHCFMAGRTATGERVWDVERIIDWASDMPQVDAARILVMGNSGGGMVTTYAAACDERVTVAVPSCSFCTYVGENGLAHHCDCNLVPGIYRFGEFSDVAGLIAPRHLLIVNGRQDDLFPLSEVDRAVGAVAQIYNAAGRPERFAHRYGEAGHRFYSDLMWPFVAEAMA